MSCKVMFNVQNAKCIMFLLFRKVDEKICCVAQADETVATAHEDFKFENYLFKIKLMLSLFTIFLTSRVYIIKYIFSVR